MWIGGKGHSLGRFTEKETATQAYAAYTRAGAAHRQAEDRRERGELGAWLEERKKSRMEKVFSRYNF